MKAQAINYDDPNAPWIPSDLYPDGPKLCPCGHHEGYHSHSGSCWYAKRCRCSGLPADCFTPIEAFQAGEATRPAA